MSYGERKSAGGYESDGQCVCARRAAGVDHVGGSNLTVDWPSELGSVLAATPPSPVPFTVVGGIVSCIGDVGPVAILVGVVQRFEDHVEGSLLALIEGGRQAVDPREGRGLGGRRRRGRRGWVLLRRVLPVIFDSRRCGQSVFVGVTVGVAVVAVRGGVAVSVRVTVGVAVGVVGGSAWTFRWAWLSAWAVGVAVVSVGVAVGMGVSVGVAVGMGVSVGVAVGMGVSVGVAVGMGVSVGVAVGMGVSVGVAVGMGVSVGVAVGMGVSVGVAVGMGVSVGVAVGMGVSVGVAVGMGVSVGVAVGGSCDLGGPTVKSLLLQAIGIATSEPGSV